jgi:hypothetical protein
LGWGLAEEWYNKLTEGDEIDVAYAPQINRYQGKRCVQFVIKEIAMGGDAPIESSVNNIDETVKE